MRYKMSKTRHLFESPSQSSSSMKDEPADDVLTAKLNKMSLQERSDGLHDLHGVADAEPETPELIRTKTMEMNNALDNAASLRIEEDSSAYHRAMELSPEYVERLKVQCLRADTYDARAAAMRMVRFFDHKRQLFGEKKIVQEIGFRDLDREAASAVENGFVQLLPLRDRTGRAIIMVYGRTNADYSTNAILQALFYMHMVGIQDEDCQKQGFVFLYYGAGQTKIVPGRSKLITKYRLARPCRYAAMHIWDDMNALQAMLGPVLSKILESRSLVRLRFHSGTHVEVIYNLMTFGIPKAALPMTLDGEMNLTTHHEFLKAIRHKEELTLARTKSFSSPTTVKKVTSPTTTTSNTTTTSTATAMTISDGNDGEPKILIPGPMDIIMGTRGRLAKTAPGHLRLHSILHEYREAYDEAPKYEKVVIVEFVRKRAGERGCRFLKPTEDGFFTIGDNEAVREKISHAFRNLRRGTKKSKLLQQQKNNASSNKSAKRRLGN